MNPRTITKAGEMQKAQEALIQNIMADSLKKTAEYQVLDFDPQRADVLTREMIGRGQLVPVGIGRNVRGLSFMPVETTD